MVSGAPPSVLSHRQHFCNECIFSSGRNQPPGGCYSHGHIHTSELMSTHRCGPLCAGSKPSPPRHSHTCTVAIIPPVLFSATEGVCVGPSVRPLRLLLALVSCVCWRWADVTLAEKFIYSLMLYTRFQLHTGWQGSAGDHPACLGAKLKTSSSQSHIYVRTHTCGPFSVPNSHHAHVFGLREESGESEGKPNPRKTPWIEPAMFLLGGD